MPLVSHPEPNDDLEHDCEACKGVMKERFDNEPNFIFEPAQISSGYGSKARVPIPGLWPDPVMRRRKGHFNPGRGAFITDVKNIRITRYGLAVMALVNDDPTIHQIEGYDFWRCINCLPKFKEKYLELRDENPSLKRSNSIATKLLLVWIEWLEEHQEHLGLLKKSPFRTREVQPGEFNPVDVLNRDVIPIQSSRDKWSMKYQVA